MEGVSDSLCEQQKVSCAWVGLVGEGHLLQYESEVEAAGLWPLLIELVVTIETTDHLRP